PDVVGEQGARHRQGARARPRSANRAGRNRKGLAGVGYPCGRSGQWKASNKNSTQCLGISRETPTHTPTTAGSTTKYTKNGGSFVTHRPSQPSINCRLAKLCCKLPVAVLPH